MILPVSFFTRPTLKVVEDLIGMVLIRKSEEGTTSGVIVEAEAYKGEDDPASFASRGRTKKSEMLYGAAARAFVYLTYGIHFMLNVITEKKDYPAAVLIRAVEPLDGIALMKSRRGIDDLANLCSGPAKLCQAFAIDLFFNGVSISSSKSPLYIEQRSKEREGSKEKKELIWRPRIGIREGKERLWRVCQKGSPFISVV